MHYSYAAHPLVKEIVLPHSAAHELKAAYAKILHGMTFVEYVKERLYPYVAQREETHTISSDDELDWRSDPHLNRIGEKIIEEIHLKAYNAFDSILSRSEAGRAFRQSLHDTMVGAEGTEQAVLVKGLPQDKEDAALTMAAMQIVLGQKNLHMGAIQDGENARSEIDRFIEDVGVDTVTETFLHQDTYTGKPVNSTILYGSNEIRNQRTPTAIALGDEMILAAAKYESTLRTMLENGDYDDAYEAGERSETAEFVITPFEAERTMKELKGLLPPVDASTEEKAAWIKGVMEKYDFSTDRSDTGALPHYGYDRERYFPGSDDALFKYMHTLMYQTSRDHYYATNLFIPSGGALILNNRTTFHGRGYPIGPEIEGQEENRLMWRVIVNSNNTNNGVWMPEDMLLKANQVSLDR